MVEKNTISHKLVEKELNEEAKRILLLIKNDYYHYMSSEKKKMLDDLINNGQIVIVNQGMSPFNDNTIAHGGRALKDGKIHFYPDVRNFNTEEAINVCKKRLPHECFHYFIQPDKFGVKEKLEKEMACFYTEGLVEKEARKFWKNHKDVVDFEKANYGYNINFVNMVQAQLGASSYEVVFSEDEYIKNINKYISQYKEILKQEKHNLDVITQIAKKFPTDMQNKVSRRMKNIVLQDGSATAIKEKLKEFEFISVKILEQLDVNNEKELD